MSEQSPPEFFKVYLPDLSSKRLRIPQAFIKHFNGTIPRQAILKILTGKLWHVKLEETEGKLFIQDGWEDFVSDNCLEHGEFLVFSYNKNSIFDVRHFGLNGCNKGNGLASVKINTHVKTEEDSEAVQVVCDSDSDRKPTSSCKRKLLETSGRKSDNLESAKISRRQSSRTAATNVENCKVLEAENNVTNHEDAKADDKFEQTNHEDAKDIEAESIAQNNFSLPKVEVEMQENAGTLDPPSKFDSEGPSFEVVLTNSYLLKGNLSIPRSFVRQYLKKSAYSVKLQVANRCWVVKYFNGKFSAGWSAFVRDNSLLEGDLCVFKLIKVNDIVLKVTTIRRF